MGSHGDTSDHPQDSQVASDLDPTSTEELTLEERESVDHLMNLDVPTANPSDNYAKRRKEQAKDGATLREKVKRVHFVSLSSLALAFQSLTEMNSRGNVLPRTSATVVNAVSEVHSTIQSAST